ncbi:MAG: hypothetical protein R3F17_16055 [Planctomycetota bacterium]
MQRTRPNALSQGRAILGCELLQLVRDRRALFAAIVLPVLLYPWLFAGQGKIEQMSRQRLAERELQAVSGTCAGSASRGANARGRSSPRPSRSPGKSAKPPPRRPGTGPLTSRRCRRPRREAAGVLPRADANWGKTCRRLGRRRKARRPWPSTADVKNDSSREAQERVERP